MSLVLEKRTLMRHSIRKEYKNQFFNSVRDTTLNNQILEQYTQKYKYALRTKNINYVLQSMLGWLMSLPREKAKVHFMAVSFSLGQCKEVIIRNARVIENFLKLTEEILKGPFTEAIYKLATFDYINWLLGYSLEHFSKSEQMKNQASSICYQLSRAYGESQFNKSDMLPENIVHDAISNLQTTLSPQTKRILFTILMFTSSSHLSYSTKSKLTSLARYLFSSVSNDFCWQPSVEDHLLLSIGRLIGFQQCDSQILDYLLNRFGGRASRRSMLELIYKQSVQQQWVRYRLVREVLLQLKEYIDSFGQQVLMLLLRNLILNEDAQCQQLPVVSIIYKDFFQGKLQLLIQPYLFTTLFQILAVIAATNLQEKYRNEFISCCIRCIELSATSNQATISKEQLSHLRMKLILNLTAGGYFPIVTGIQLIHYLQPEERQFFWQKLQLTSKDETNQI